LLGPQGIGGIILSPRLAPQLEPLITGGTGSSSEEEFQPAFMPDRFEAGTLNIPGIYGLNAALKYLHEIGIAHIHQTESSGGQVIQVLCLLNEVKLIGLPFVSNRPQCFMDSERIMPD
jgi:selenocysteine lyase/cysteine desulfurase